jgi:hypothetical protein
VSCSWQYEGKGAFRGAFQKKSLLRFTNHSSLCGNPAVRLVGSVDLNRDWWYARDEFIARVVEEALRTASASDIVMDLVDPTRLQSQLFDPLKERIKKRVWYSHVLFVLISYVPTM